MDLDPTTEEATELVEVRYSDDGGKTWTAWRPVNQSGAQAITTVSVAERLARLVKAESDE